MRGGNVNAKEVQREQFLAEVVQLLRGTPHIPLGQLLDEHRKQHNLKACVRPVREFSCTSLREVRAPATTRQTAQVEDGAPLGMADHAGLMSVRRRAETAAKA